MTVTIDASVKDFTTTTRKLFIDGEWVDAAMLPPPVVRGASTFAPLPYLPPPPAFVQGLSVENVPSNESPAGSGGLGGLGGGPPGRWLCHSSLPRSLIPALTCSGSMFRRASSSSVISSSRSGPSFMLRILSCSLKIASISISGRGGQPGR